MSREIILRNHEYPRYIDGEWSASTRYGMVWQVLPCKIDNKNSDLYSEALAATRKIIETGQPLTGGWK